MLKSITKISSSSSVNKKKCVLLCAHFLIPLALSIMIVVSLGLEANSGNEIKKKDENDWVYKCINLDNGLISFISNKKEQIKIAVLDTGTSLDEKYPNISLIDSSFDSGLKDSEHGDLINYILLDLLPNAKIYSIKIGGNENIPISNIVSGIENAIELKVDVINLSVSTYHNDRTLSQKVHDALNNNIPIVASVGNDFYNGYSYPASYKGVIGVSAVNKNMQYLPNANTNDKISVCGPGVYFLNTENKIYYGNSVAVPYVVALIGYMKMLDKNLKVSDIKKIIQNTATDLGPPGKDEIYGYGLVNYKKAILSLRKDAFIKRNIFAYSAI